MSAFPLREFLETLRNDQQVRIRALLKEHAVDLNDMTVTCDQYDIDDPDEIPLLFWVVQSGVSLEAIMVLIEHGLDITVTNREGVGALDIAIKHRRMDIVRLCARSGVSLSQSRRRSGMTPLMVAASFNQREIVDYLLENGADIDATDARGADAAEYARMLGFYSMASYLKEKGESQKEKQGA
jgi:ankyrin repeat protein